MIVSTDFIILCRAFSSAVEHPAYQTVRQYVKMLAMAEWSEAANSLLHSLFLLRARRKWRRRCAFFATAVVFVDQERSDGGWLCTT